jgi:nitroreductase
VEFREILKRRRMVRAYTGEQIPRDALERIVGTVLRAPSGGFSQGHRLFVVTSPDTRGRIAELFDEAAQVAEGREPWIGSASALVVVGTREASYHERYQRADKLQDGEEIEWPVPYWHVDAGAAMMLILLAAIDEGYGAGVFGVPVEDEPAFKKLLEIPDDVAVVACVTIGRPADDPSWSAVSSRLTQARKRLDELVRWE